MSILSNTRRIFRPRPLPCLLLLGVAMVFFHLGQWQLDRAGQKRALAADREHKQALPELGSDVLDAHTLAEPALLWRRVRLRGEFQDRHILLDNQMRQGRPGYLVFSPFRVAATGVGLLVNRGWVPAGQDRSQPPYLQRVTGPLLLHGTLKPSPFSGIRLKQHSPERLTPRLYRVHSILPGELETLLEMPLLPVVLRLGPESVAGYIRESPVLAVGVERHLAYAFQWFVLMLTSLVICLMLSFRPVRHD